MISIQSRVIIQSIDCSFLKDIFLLKELKALVKEQANHLEIAKLFRHRLYTYAEIISFINENLKYLQKGKRRQYFEC